MFVWIDSRDSCLNSLVPGQPCRPYQRIKKKAHGNIHIPGVLTCENWKKICFENVSVEESIVISSVCTASNELRAQRLRRFFDGCERFNRNNVRVFSLNVRIFGYYAGGQRYLLLYFQGRVVWIKYYLCMVQIFPHSVYSRRFFDCSERFNRDSFCIFGLTVHIFGWYAGEQRYFYFSREDGLDQVLVGRGSDCFRSGIFRTHPWLQ